MLTKSEEELCEKFVALSLAKPLAVLDAVQTELPVRLRYLYLLELRLPRGYEILCQHGGDAYDHGSHVLKVGLTSEDDGPLLTRLLREARTGDGVTVDAYLAHPDRRVQSSSSRLYAINYGLEKLFGRDHFTLLVRLFVPLPLTEGREKLESTFRRAWGTPMPSDWPSFFLNMTRQTELYKKVCRRVAPTEWILVDRRFVARLTDTVTGCRQLMHHGKTARSLFCTVPGPLRFRLELDRELEVQW